MSSLRYIYEVLDQQLKSRQQSGMTGIDLYQKEDQTNHMWSENQREIM